MGPRAFAHGDASLNPLQITGSFRFNGAAGFRPRRHRFQRNSFRETRELQWGRGLSPTETAKKTGTAPIDAIASMGPRAFAHGDAIHLRRKRLHPLRFNGAAGFRPRRLSFKFP